MIPTVIIRSYQEAEAFLKGGNYRKIPSIRSTAVVRRGTYTIGLKYHNTYVVTYFAGGAFSLETGGYKTVTTKKRMNDFTPYNVYQKNFDWFVGGNGLCTMPFQDSILLVPSNARGVTSDA